MITRERRAQIRKKCLIAKQQSEGLLAGGENAIELHKLLNTLFDFIIELETDLVLRDHLKAHAVIALRDALLGAVTHPDKANEYHTEAYHQLVKYADPDFTFNHWSEHENIKKGQ
jgi:hypothetical protein